MLNSFQLTTPTRRCPTRRGSCSPSARSTPPPARAMLCSRGGFGTLAGEPTCPQRNRHGVFRYPALPSNPWLKSPRPCWVDSLSVSQGSRRCGHGFRPTPGKFPGRPSPPASEKSIWQELWLFDRNGGWKPNSKPSSRHIRNCTTNEAGMFPQSSISLRRAGRSLSLMIFWKDMPGPRWPDSRQFAPPPPKARPSLSRSDPKKSLGFSRAAIGRT